ncbi:uncharacterized protein LOC142102282 isoform X2 [Mixophyes fleayi]|uniref:uncharacterized protein LOC142102282 isoform X2 n=1 Tax=Mixophyes fleayi TaxID=3061075 RepID=UPI003F4DAF67
MRTFLGSHKTPHKKANPFLTLIMAAADVHRGDAGVANTTAGSPLAMGDMVGEGAQETEEEGVRNEGCPVIWGEFQGTQQNEAEGESDWYKRGLHGCRPEDSWVAFREADSEEPETDKQEMYVTQHGGRWWCEDSTTMCPTEDSIDKSSVGQIFDQCFPSVLHTPVEEDVQPLELLLRDDGSQGHKQIWRRSCDDRSAGCLWGLSDRTRDPDHLYKWEGSQLCTAYLSSLHIDPNGKIPPHRTKFPTSSPAPKQRLHPHKLSTGLGREPELKLTKVASVSVHVTGFSPSHHLQSLFQHWSQPNGKTRLKVAYDFNRSLLV